MTGHPYDTVLDIYFAEARFYDAKYRQWMASDPIKDGLNWYEYCEGNPATYFDPTGLFTEYTKYLEGTGSANIKDKESREILTVQTRLMTLGYLDVSNITMGKLDKNTMKAVERYRADEGLAKLPVIDHNMWQSLGFELEREGQYWSAPLESIPEYQIGTALAQNIAYSISQKTMRLYMHFNEGNKTKVIVDASHFRFSSITAYFQKLECLVRSKGEVKIAGQIADTFASLQNTLGQVMSVTGGEPWTTAGGTAILMVPELYSIWVDGAPNLTGQAGFSDIGKLLGDLAYDKDIQRTLKTLELLDGTSMGFAISSDAIPNINFEDRIKDSYAQGIAKTVKKLRDYTLVVEGMDVDEAKVMEYAISYLEQSIKYSYDEKSVDEFIDFSVN